MKCFKDDGRGNKCNNEATHKYVMDGGLSDTFLCEDCCKEADNNSIVKAHLINKLHVSTL